MVRGADTGQARPHDQDIDVLHRQQAVDPAGGAPKMRGARRPLRDRAGLGRGGMARVHLARQLDLDRYAALKELGSLHREDAEMAARFVRESRLAGALNHPSIVTVLDFFEHDGTPYIAMEYVPRGSLRPWVGQLSLAQVGGVLESVLAGLAHAHAGTRRAPRPQAREPDGHRRRAASRSPTSGSPRR